MPDEIYVHDSSNFNYDGINKSHKDIVVSLLKETRHLK